MEFTKLQILGIILFLSFASGILAGKVGSNQYNNQNNLKCYSCVHIQNFPNASAEGCSKRRPPSQYKTPECFGFANPTALAAIRHVSRADQFGRVEDPDNVHCVNIKGKSRSGGEILIRGCAALPEDEVYEKRTCMSAGSFPYPPHGTVEEVEYCYCKGDGCNASVPLGISLSLILAAVISKHIF